MNELHRRAVAAFGERVHGMPPGTWRWPTTCEAWDVRALVHHLVEECRWAPPLLRGATIAGVGDRLAGDLLGDDPVGAWDAAAEEAVAAADGTDPAATVHLSFGAVPAREYLHQLAADHLVHAWDLARATGQDESLDPEVVDGVLAWFGDAEPLYRAAGVIGPAVEAGQAGDVGEDGDAGPAGTGLGAQAELLARFGRDPSPGSTLAAVARFNVAFAAADFDGIAAAVTGDCVFVDTAPPDGARHEGRDAIVAAFRGVLGSAGAAFETEEGFVCGDRAVFRWRYSWDGGHVRGVDLFAVRDGLVAEKLSYVKG